MATKTLSEVVRYLHRAVGSSDVEPSDGEATGEPTTAETALPYALAGIGEKTVRKLVEGGFGSIEAVTGATVEQLSELPGIGEKTAEKILAAARGDSEPDQGTTAETEERS